MVGGKDEATFSGEFSKQAGKRFGGIPIQTSEGFIKKEDMGFLSECPGEKGPLLLPPRELADLTVTKISNAQSVEGVLNGFMVFICVTFPQSKVGVSSHFDQTAYGDGEIPVDLFPLGKISELAGPLFHGCATPLDVPPSPWDQACDGLQKSRFSSAIGSNQCYPVSAGSSHRNIPEGSYRSVGNLEVTDNQLMVVIVVRTAVVLAMGFCFQESNALNESLSPGIEISSDRIAFGIASEIEENMRAL